MNFAGRDPMPFLSRKTAQMEFTLLTRRRQWLVYLGRFVFSVGSVSHARGDSAPCVHFPSASVFQWQCQGCPSVTRESPPCRQNAPRLSIHAVAASVSSWTASRHPEDVIRTNGGRCVCPASYLRRRRKSSRQIDLMAAPGADPDWRLWEIGRGSTICKQALRH